MAKRVYGIPYKGSKCSIAEQLVARLPKGQRFCDACCGGGAVFHVALASGKYESIEAFDVNYGVTNLLSTALQRHIDVPVRLVTREEFLEKKNRFGTKDETLDDTMVRYTHTFGYNGEDYLWGVGSADYKYLLHDIVAKETMNERRETLRDFFTKLDKDNPGDKVTLTKRLLNNWKHQELANNICRLQNVLDDIHELYLKRPIPVYIGKMSLFDLDYSRYDVIYFDPPYRNTKGYRVDFDFEKFDKLLARLKGMGKDVFVSEYSDIDGYTCVAKFAKCQSVCATKNVGVIEKLLYSGSPERYVSLVD